MRVHIYSMNDNITVFDFSGIYNEESFYQNDKSSPFCIINCRDIPGTNCMCDDEAIAHIKNKIKERMLEYPDFEDDEERMSFFAKGIHFIDSGNYHYMSAIITDMIKEPFSLVVLDHHPDMQPPMFGDILSCGGWVMRVIENNPYVKDIHVIGADRNLIEELDKNDAKRVSFYDVSDVRDKLLETRYPVFLSIDKDVVRREELVTNWDQGEMTKEELITFIKELFDRREVLGVDICGECAPDQEGIDVGKEAHINDALNLEILKEIKNFLASGGTKRLE